MNKNNFTWTIKDLEERYNIIEFPEYQREPTVWNLDKKQKLIDSILRKFDIANIYLHKRDDGNYECIDGRQRINAIISFLGLNEQIGGEEDGSRSDNNFKFRSSDELLGSRDLEAFNNKGWKDLKQNQRNQILDYKFNVLEITDIDKHEELNLMFLRLQLGAPLNAGEKLKAMVGDMRDFIFKYSKSAPSLGKHPYFEYLDIPKRRFSRELTAAQMTINFFSLQRERVFRRARFLDLQEFFKTNVKFGKAENEIASLLRARLNSVYKSMENKASKVSLKNRAIGITTFFFINEMIGSKEESNIPSFVKFLQLFLKRLKEQVKKGIDIDPQYRDLLKFQTYISQAAVEKYAIENRQKFLQEYFDYYLKHKKIKGDN
jgi:hypothetical protein